jgi:hypothetical protein
MIIVTPGSNLNRESVQNKKPLIKINKRLLLKRDLNYFLNVRT